MALVAIRLYLLLRVVLFLPLPCLQLPVPLLPLFVRLPVMLVCIHHPLALLPMMLLAPPELRQLVE